MVAAEYWLVTDGLRVNHLLLVMGTSMGCMHSWLWGERNPPELGIMEQLIRRVKHGRYVLLPISERTRGHGTHTVAAAWKEYFAPFSAALEHAGG